MYDIWYTLLKPIFGHVLTLILMETDSFVYSVLGMREQKFNKTVLKNPRLKNYLEFSKFPNNHPLYTNENTEGCKMKSERKVHLINYAIALRSKMHYLEIINIKISDIEKLK